MTRAFQTVGKRIGKCVQSALPQGIKTAAWLLKITIPVSFLVFLLDYSGWMTVLANFLAPAFRLIGLSGEAAVVLITSFFTNIYSVIAVMTTLGTEYREGTIMAVMCLIAHSLIIETAILKKTGSSAWRMVWLRLIVSFVAGMALNWILPGTMAGSEHAVLHHSTEFSAALLDWLKAISQTTIKIIVLVNLLLILQKILSEFGIIEWIVKPFVPLLKIMGLPENSGFLWIVAYTLGLSYGGAIMISQTEEGELSREDADLLNHHIAVSHSQLEDPLLFVAVGYNYIILCIPRIILAVMVVWLRKLEIYLLNKRLN